MMEIYSEDIEILRELISKESVDLYCFHEKYKLSPAQLARVINKFIEINLIIVSNNVISLTKDGNNWVFKNRKVLFLKERKKYWKEIPEEMKQEKIEINELYKPNRKKLDKELFKNIEDGK